MVDYNFRSGMASQINPPSAVKKGETGASKQSPDRAINGGYLDPHALNIQLGQAPV